MCTINIFNFLEYYIKLKEKLLKLKEEKISEEEMFDHPSIPKCYEEPTPKFINKILSFWYKELKA